jgi:hypothetical protein
VNRWFVVMLMISTGAMAGWTAPDGAKIADTDFRKSNGQFISQLVLVSDAQKLYSDWEKPSTYFHATETQSVSRNSEISAFVIFGGCKADKSGNCNVTVNFKITAPDGSVYADVSDMEVWAGRPAPPTQTLQLSVGFLKAIIEQGEQLGKYQVAASVVDRNSSREVMLTKSFTATEAN